MRALTLAASALAVTALATTCTVSSLKLTASTLAASALTLTATGTAQHHRRLHRPVHAHIFKSSHRPHVRLTFARSLQGGGVFVEDGTVTFSSCTRES